MNEPVPAPARRGFFERLLQVTLRDIIRLTVRVVLGVIALGFLVLFALIHLPERQIAALEPVSEVRYLDQGWGTSMESPLRQAYYYTSQGSTIKDLRYSWFVHLERPWGYDRFADPDHLRRLGFIVDPMPTHDNPNQLPLGFTKHFDPQLNEDVLDITCAACHSGQINVTRNGRTTGIRIDGGAAMHAFTAVHTGHFLPVLLGSMTSTMLNPIKFNRFARNVLGDAYDTGKGRLRREFVSVLMTLLQQARSDATHKLYPTDEGFGRTDALARIGNVVFGGHISPANLKVGNGPVSYPYLWNIWMFDWVQYNASVSQPMARNVGEVLGVGAKISFLDPYGRPLPEAERYRSSVQFDHLLQIESTLQQLKPPPWPEDLLGRIDQAKAERGKALFEQHCVGCHGPHPATDAIRMRDAPLRTALEPLWQIHPKDVTDVGTDPRAAMNFYNNTVDLTRIGLDRNRVEDVLRGQQREFQKRNAIAITTLQQQVATLSAGPELDATREALAYAQSEALTDAQIEAALDKVNLSSINIGQGLNILGLIIRDKYYTDNRFSDSMRACYEGFGMLDLPQVVPGYKPRPLQGVWATPPFLHNGSVPNLYELLSPGYERSTKFYVGRREFDPERVGYRLDPLSKGGFWFDTRLPGNFNTGHEFRSGYVPYDENNPQVQYGVIGPELTPAQRYDLIEYLKIHQDGPTAPPDRRPADCLAPTAATTAPGASR
jgi:hypothetical protein